MYLLIFDYCHVSLLDTSREDIDVNRQPYKIHQWLLVRISNNVSVHDLLGKLVMYNRYFPREIVYIWDILYEFIFFFNVQYRLPCNPVMTLIDTFDVCIFLGREANRLCIGARKSANNICVIMNVLSLVFTKFTHPYGFIWIKFPLTKRVLWNY